MSVNGELQAWDYEFSLTRGTGNEWSSRGDPFLVAGRVATSRDEELSLALSAFHGEVQKTQLPGNTLERTRVGLDFTWQMELLVVMGELSLGRDGSTDVINGILEIDWTNPSESVLVYNQLVFFNSDLPTGWEDASANILGVRWSMSNDSSLSAQWKQDLSVFSGEKNSSLALQFRHRL